jgi:predicted DNA-binding protein YlxM (UPF0122 family)
MIRTVNLHLFYQSNYETIRETQNPLYQRKTKIQIFKKTKQKSKIQKETKESGNPKLNNELNIQSLKKPSSSPSDTLF